jgi:exodeoxyribonuclease-3
MKLTTWNVNGLRARLTHVVDFLREHRPDVLCLQETKVQDEAFPKEPLEDEGYNVLRWGQKSYNGIAILSQRPVEDVFTGLPGDPDDGERRVLGCIAGDLMVLDLYAPNGQEVGGERYREKLDWFRRLRAFVDGKYSTAEKVALVGDFNVALEDRDVFDPDLFREQLHCSTQERAAMRQLLAFGFDDLLRKKHPEAGIYTWWNYQAGAAFKDEGLRIDYVLTTAPLTRACVDVIVHREVRTKKSPSDHVPVTAVFADQGAA